MPALTAVRATTTARAAAAGASGAAPVTMTAAAPAPAIAPPAAPSAAPLGVGPAAAPLVAAPTRDAPSPRVARDEQIDAAEAALQRGDHSAATQLLTPWAAAGVARAQVLLGRAQQARPAGGQSDFEAYVWFSMAARGGEPSAQAMRDKVAAKLQPAEIRQAQQIVEHWRPHAEPVAAATR